MSDARHSARPPKDMLGALPRAEAVIAGLVVVLFAGMALLAIQFIGLHQDLETANSARDALASQVQRLGASRSRVHPGAEVSRAGASPAPGARRVRPGRPDRPVRRAGRGRPEPTVWAGPAPLARQDRPALPGRPGKRDLLGRRVPLARRGLLVPPGPLEVTAPTARTGRRARTATPSRPPTTTRMLWSAARMVHPSRAAVTPRSRRLLLSTRSAASTADPQSAPRRPGGGAFVCLRVAEPLLSLRD